MIKKLNFKYIYKFKLELVSLMFIIVCGIALNSYSPIVYGRIIDGIANKKNYSWLKDVSIFGVLNLAILLLSSFEGMVAEYLINKIIMSYQKKIYTKVIRARFNEVEKIDLGTLISNLTSDVVEIVGFNIGIITTIVFLAMNTVGPLILIFVLSKKLALLTMLFLPVPVLVYFFFKRKKRELHIKSKKLDDRYYKYIVNSIDNISNIKLYKIEQCFESVFSDVAYKTYRTTLQKTILESLISGINTFSLNVFTILILFAAAQLIYLNEFSIGGLITFSIYTNRLFEGIDSLLKLKLNEQEVDVSIKRLSEIENLVSDRYEVKNTEEFGKISKICFERIFFTYDNKENNVLNGLSLLINGNGFYSIVGANGCGKTTLLKLLVQFYRPQEGNIFINDISYEKLTEYEIRSKITYVQKKAFILDGTILDNIRLDKKISEEIVREVCERVGLTEFIDSLSDRLYTRLSSDSDDISSGIRQKLNFARALLHESDIMIFDEVSSDLDGNSEMRLCQIMRELGRERIVISVSHRINTIMMSDYVYYLSNGKIESEGRFDELVETNRTFKNLISLNKE